jgi:hypothetical protein
MAPPKAVDVMVGRLDHAKHVFNKHYKDLAHVRLSDHWDHSRGIWPVGGLLLDQGARLTLPALIRRKTSQQMDFVWARDPPFKSDLINVLWAFAQ